MALLHTWFSNAPELKRRRSINDAMRFNDSSSVFRSECYWKKVSSPNSRQFSFASSKCGSICLILAVHVYLSRSFYFSFLFLRLHSRNSFGQNLTPCVCCYPSKLQHLILFWILLCAIYSRVHRPSVLLSAVQWWRCKNFSQSEDFFLRFSTKAARNCV